MFGGVLFATLALTSCQPAAGGAPEPAWPEQEPPEYPGVAPSGAGASAAPDANSPTSRSPLAAAYGPRSTLEQLSGKATYYADSLAGNSTASGEPYQPAAFTAAHRTLPFGTVVRVTRIDTRSVTYVKINDRGPFGNQDRIIDLSRAAASELGMLRAGVVPVEVEVLEKPR
jgi:rare lipoprotein A